MRIPRGFICTNLPKLASLWFQAIQLTLERGQDKIVNMPPDELAHKLDMPWESAVYLQGRLGIVYGNLLQLATDMEALFRMTITDRMLGKTKRANYIKQIKRAIQLAHH